MLFILPLISAFFSFLFEFVEWIVELVYRRINIFSSFYCPLFV